MVSVAQVVPTNCAVGIFVQKLIEKFNGTFKVINLVITKSQFKQCGLVRSVMSKRFFKDKNGFFPVP